MVHLSTSHEPPVKKSYERRRIIGTGAQSVRHTNLAKTKKITANTQQQTQISYFPSCTRHVSTRLVGETKQLL